MKLYHHPISTTSRAVMLFVAEQRIPVDMRVVDLFSGEHLRDAYAAINPNRLVPALQDGDFVLTESAAILKYLADSIDSGEWFKVGTDLGPVWALSKNVRLCSGVDGLCSCGGGE